MQNKQKLTVGNNGPVKKPIKLTAIEAAMIFGTLGFYCELGYHDKFEVGGKIIQPKY